MTVADKEATVLETVADANEAASKGPLAALLTPAATVFGKELGGWAEKIVARRKKNVDAHIQAVGSGVAAPLGEEPTPALAHALHDWERAAGDVDDQDVEEAALWRGLLEGILSQQGDKDRLVATASALTRSDIVMLVRLGDPRRVRLIRSLQPMSAESIDARDRLMSFQLVRRNINTEGVVLFILPTFIAVVVFWIFSAVFPTFNDVFNLSSGVSLQLLFPIILVSIVGFLLYRFPFFIIEYNLTGRGRRLRGLVSKYLPKRAPQK